MGTDLPNQRESHEACRIAREELAQITNENRVKHALKSKVPESTDVFYKPGDMVRVFRQELNQCT